MRSTSNPCPWGALTLAILALIAPQTVWAQSSADASTGYRELVRHVTKTFDLSRAQLLILGTFHFEDAGRDDYKPEHRLDILSEAKQQELTEVIDRLAAFRPTRVAVEWPKESQARCDARYQRYVRGELEPNANEVVQLGFRLAKRMGHERVWPVDTMGRNYEPPIDRTAIASEWGRSETMDSHWWVRYDELSRWSDELKTKIPIRDYLLFLNSEPALRANAGQYFIGGFNLVRGDSYPGPDRLAGWWYDRNLRIFANVQALAESTDDRIVLIIGQGHVPILRHAAQVSPDVELIDVSDVLAGD